MKTSICFEALPVHGGTLINDGDRTVAIVNQNGYVDWLLRSPLEEGPLHTSIPKGTHLSYTLGVKFELGCPEIATPGKGGGTMGTPEVRIEEEGGKVVLIGRGKKGDDFLSYTEAHLTLSSDETRYEWKLLTRITNTTKDNFFIKELEFNNVYPSLAYRGILHGDRKEFDRTLALDQSGTVQNFPHQHTLHYGKKLKEMLFGRTSWAGFFGPEDEALIVEVHSSPIDLHWAICDMFYDLHCMAKPCTLPAGKALEFQYAIRFLTLEASRAFLEKGKLVGFTPEDYQKHHYPRLEMGVNRFKHPAPIATASEALCWRPSLPDTQWEEPIHPGENGAIVLHGSAGKTVSIRTNPPIHVRAGRTLSARCLVELENVTAPGFTLAVKQSVYCWEPEAGFQPGPHVVSAAVSGDGTHWVTLPPVTFEEDSLEDMTLNFFLELAGEGTARVRQMEVACEPI